MRIYIAHPYTGDEVRNRERALRAEELLRKATPQTAFYNPVGRMSASKQFAGMSYAGIMAHCLGELGKEYRLPHRGAGGAASEPAALVRGGCLRQDVDARRDRGAVRGGSLMTETTRMQELIEIFCDADRRQGLTAEEIEQYCPNVGSAVDAAE